MNLKKYIRETEWIHKIVFSSCIFMQNEESPYDRVVEFHIGRFPFGFLSYSLVSFSGFYREVNPKVINSKNIRAELLRQLTEDEHVERRFFV